MIDPSPTTETLLGYGGGVTALLLGANYFIRLFSRGRVESKEDGARINIIETLQAENRLLREQATIAYRERNEAHEELAQLRTAFALLKRDLQQAEERFELLKARIDDLDRRKD